MSIKTKLKRILSSAVASAMALTMLPSLSAFAEDEAKYPYTMFAASELEGAITINASNVSVNGSIATNGTVITANEYPNINGARKENASEEMIYIFEKLDSKYFSAKNMDEYNEDYILEEMNININKSLEVKGEIDLTGNLNLNTGMKALEDINLRGEVKNTNNSVIFSKYGDIVIDSMNANLNGLIYAPFGNVEITAQNLNLNNIVIIAQTITINCPNMNANYDNNMAQFVGNTSEPLHIPYDEWQYMKDENENDIPDFFEDMNNWAKLRDTDGDGLPDCVEQYIGSDSFLTDTDGDGLDDYYEVLVLYTNPTKLDSDANEINDGDEDFDADGLNNIDEYNCKTNPYNPDSDDDELKDGDEVHVYITKPLVPDTDNDGLKDADEIYLGTDPLIPDTNGNGILDGDEKFSQEYVHKVESKDCAVSEVIVSMEGTGNLQSTTTVDSMMNKDKICSEVVGLVGEPFEINTSSKFNTATISFKIDQSKLGNTKFDDLMFIWYDEENNDFIELDTIYDIDKSIVSVNTTHFSRYMIVDKYTWFEAWAVEFNYNPGAHQPGAPTIRYNTVLAIDCSGSMSTWDPISSNPVNSPSDAKYAKTCQRIKAGNEFVRNINKNDKVAVVLFESSARIVASMTNNNETLLLALQKVTNGGGTSFNAAINTSLNAFDSKDIGAINTNNRIILLSDGESSVSNDVLKSSKDKNIKIYTVGLGSGSGDATLNKISKETGGQFFKALTADDLIDIYAEIGFGDDFDKTDTDGDGLYDTVETAGIRLQNGSIIYTDPTNPDTDGDGLMDGKEIDPKPIHSNKTIHHADGSVVLARGYFFKMESDPRYKDTDSDYIPDAKDERPLSINYNNSQLTSNAAEAINENSEYIINAANFYNVDPCIVAACIFTEQDLNYDWKDQYFDYILSFYNILDMSVGLGQMRVSTAKFIEDMNYIEEAKATDGGWNVPIIGNIHGTEQMMRVYRLNNNESNVYYVAAYIRYFVDVWEDNYNEISNRPDILATLYNLGHEITSPNSSPQSNSFGDHANDYYYMMYLLLYGY